jgi:hypothetical protein
MKEILGTAKFWILGIALFASLAGMSPAAPAQTATVTYVLDDVWLLPDISHPWEPSRQMTGTFEWTYDIGDFENGSGQFTDLYIPWYGTNIAELKITVELNSIEFSLLGNYHDRGLDMTLFFLTPLSLGNPSVIDTARSIFDIQQGVSYKGHVVSGSVVPDLPLSLSIGGTCPHDVRFSIDKATPNGQVALLYALAPGSFVIPNGFPFAGTMLGLNNTVALGAVITANTNGLATLNTSVPPGACGNIFLQALDFTDQATSNVVLLQ